MSVPPRAGEDAARDKGSRSAGARGSPRDVTSALAGSLDVLPPRVLLPVLRLEVEVGGVEHPGPLAAGGVLAGGVQLDGPVAEGAVHFVDEGAVLVQTDLVVMPAERRPGAGVEAGGRGTLTRRGGGGAREGQGPEHSKGVGDCSALPRGCCTLSTARLTLEEREGGGGRDWDRKSWVPKIGRSDFPDCNFVFSRDGPFGLGGGGGGSSRGCTAVLMEGCPLVACGTGSTTSACRSRRASGSSAGRGEDACGLGCVQKRIPGGNYATFREKKCGWGIARRPCGSVRGGFKVNLPVRPLLSGGGGWG